jgi:signal transduction histidine kinase
MDMLQVEVENERKLMEQERTSLCGLIGNIAHDLKTPLHSISMDLELLHSSSWLKRMTREAQNERSKLFEGRGSGGESTGEVILNGLLLGPSPRKAGCKGIVDPGSVLESMQSTISFMTMAINRCIDFTKASSGIALVPTLGTFALNEAIRSAVSCVESLQSDVAITVAPLPETMCPHIVADKQWITENLLCLLSNAVKYSNGGTVDISVTITDGKPSNDCMSSCSASPLESAANTTAAVWPPEEEEEERGFRNGGDGGSCNVPCTVVEEDVEEEHQEERGQGRSGPSAIANDKANIRIGRGSSTPSSSPPYSKTKREKSAMPVSSLSVVVDEAICGGEAEEADSSSCLVSAPTSSSGSSKRPPRPPPAMIASEEEHEDCAVKFVRITVQDTGVLLPAEMKRKLFKVRI